MKPNEQAWKWAVVSVGALFCFTPAAIAAASLNFIEETPVQRYLQPMTLQLAQSNSCPDRAGGMSMEAYIETENFWIYICKGSQNQLYYHGVNKETYEFITLPAYAEEGTGYVADNGDYTYIVTGLSLGIYRGNRLLQEDSVERYEYVGGPR